MTDTVLVEVQSPYTDWLPALSVAGFFNRIGGACAAVNVLLVNPAPFTWGGSTLTTLVSAATPPVPGVIRFTCTGAASLTTHTWTKTVVQAADIKHPGAGTVTLPMAPNPVTWYGVLPGITINMGASPQIGDQFDVFYGYQQDSLSGLYLPVTAFGIVFPSAPGMIVGVRVTNTYTTSYMVNATFQWSMGYYSAGVFTENQTNFVSAKLASDATWTDGSTGWLYLQDAAAIPGVLAPGGQCELQMQPYPPSDVDPSYNLNIIVCQVGYMLC